MRQRLVKVRRRDKNGILKWKWVRPKGVNPPSRNNYYRRKYVKEIRLSIIELLGGKCRDCGYNKDIRALQIDHIKASDAKTDRKHTGGSYYHKIRNKIKTGKYQILCANCHRIKTHENREYKRKK